MKKVFECRVCGVCCKGDGGIFIRSDAAGGPAGLLGISMEEFVEKYTEPRHGMLALKTDEEGYCLLHDKELHNCRIHEEKPQMCRDWPFFHGPLNHREGFEAARGNCPGILTDVTWAEFKAWHKENIGVMPPRSYWNDPEPENEK